MRHEPLQLYIQQVLFCFINCKGHKIDPNYLIFTTLSSCRTKCMVSVPETPFTSGAHFYRLAVSNVDCKLRNCHIPVSGRKIYLIILQVLIFIPQITAPIPP